jgi:iron complex outermembrane receptor protein
MDAHLKVATPLTLELDGQFFFGGPNAQNRMEVGSELYYVKQDYSYRGGELELMGNWHLVPSLTLLTGVELILDREQLPSNLHVLKTSSGGLLPGEIREETSTRQGSRLLTNLGAYLQSEWYPIPKLALTAGLRYDYHNIYDNNFSGRAGVVYQLAEGFRFKLLYGSAFKAPSPLLLYGLPATIGDIVGNPDLKAQYVHTVEGQLSFFRWGSVSLESNLAYSWLLNKAEFTQQGLNKMAYNIAKVGGFSWETSLNGTYKSWLRGYMNVSYQYTTRALGMSGYQAWLVNNKNPIYPALMLKTGALAQNLDWHLRGTVEGSYIGARFSSDSNSLEMGEVYELTPYVELAGSLALLDIPLAPQRKLEMQLTFRNLLNVSGPMPGFSGIDYPLAPRQMMLTVRLLQ